MRREISTVTINRDIGSLKDSTLVSDGLNSFDDLYITAFSFIKIRLIENPDIIPYLSLDEDDSYFKVILSDRTMFHPTWSMKFPIKYLEMLTKFTL